MWNITNFGIYSSYTNYPIPCTEKHSRPLKLHNNISDIWKISGLPLACTTTIKQQLPIFRTFFNNIKLELLMA